MTAPSVAPRVPIKKLRPDAVLPRYMSEGAAGFDLSAALDGSVTIAPGQRCAIGTGLAMAIPPGFEGQVRPRSGLAARAGLTVINAPGTVDSDYRGEVKVLLVNLGDRDAVVEPGQRVAQMVIAPVIRAEVSEADELPASRRGAGGFGSTGS